MRADDILYGEKEIRDHSTEFIPTYKGPVRWSQLRPTTDLTAADDRYHLKMDTLRCQYPQLDAGVYTDNLAAEFIEDLYQAFELEPRQLRMVSRRYPFFSDLGMQHDSELYIISLPGVRTSPELGLPFLPIIEARAPGQATLTTSMSIKRHDWVAALNKVAVLLGLERRRTPLLVS